MKRTIMIVDDSKVNREFLKQIFITGNFDVIEAGRGGEALEFVEENKPDLMILDLNMPGIGGMETLKRIRAKGFDFPVIIFTSDDNPETKQRCLAAGATEVLFKPSKPGFIMQVISKIFISTKAVKKD